MKLLLTLYILHCTLYIAPAQTRPAMMQLNNEIKVDEQQFVIWHSYVIDSSWLNVWLPNGDLPRRENGTYLYWKADSSGNLIPLKKIDYRLPIFQEQPIVMKREKGIFE